MLLHTLLQLQWKGSCNTPNCFFMDPLNKLLNLLSHVFNNCRMWFVYLNFDTAQKVVWLCNIRWVGALGVPKIPEHTWNLKNSLPEGRCLHGDQRHAPRCLEQLLVQHNFHACFQDSFSRQTHFWLQGHHLASPLPDNLGEPDYCLWDYVKSKYTKHNLSNWWLKTLSLRFIKRIHKKCTVL